MSGGITSSPWLTMPAACDYLSGGARTEQGRRAYSPRFLAREVALSRLRAAKVGGRGQLLTRREWLDAYVEDLATPIAVTVRRRA